MPTRREPTRDLENDAVQALRAELHVLAGRLETMDARHRQEMEKVKSSLRQEVHAQVAEVLRTIPGLSDGHQQLILQRLGTGNTDPPQEAQEPLTLEMQDVEEEETPFRPVVAKKAAKRPLRAVSKTREQPKPRQPRASLDSFAWDTDSYDWRNASSCPPGYNPAVSFKCPFQGCRKGIMLNWKGFTSHRLTCERDIETHQRAMQLKKPKRSSSTKGQQKIPFVKTNTLATVSTSVASGSGLDGTSLPGMDSSSQDGSMA
jgi:hypothetical protein